MLRLPPTFTSRPYLLKPKATNTVPPNLSRRLYSTVNNLLTLNSRPSSKQRVTNIVPLIFNFQHYSKVANGSKSESINKYKDWFLASIGGLAGIICTGFVTYVAVGADSNSKPFEVCSL
jgi:hypothetical protein